MFCDSGYVILNSLKETLAKRLKVSSIAMSVALATGLYATHNFVPPTPGPIAAAGNLGLADNLGLVIVMGLVVSVPACLAGWLWANRFVHEQPQGEGAAGHASTAGSLNAADREASSPADAVAATRYADADDTDGSADQTRHAQMPSPLMAFMPIVLPIALICIGSVAAFPSRPLGSGLLFTAAAFLGKPLCALLIGFLFSLLLIRGEDRTERISALITQGLVLAAPILLITGAGGAFGYSIDTPARFGLTVPHLGIDEAPWLPQGRPMARQALITSCTRRSISGLARCTEAKSSSAALLPTPMLEAARWWCRRWTGRRASRGCDSCWPGSMIRASGLQVS